MTKQDNYATQVADDFYMPFDVVLKRSIGTVVPTEDGDMTPNEVAFLLIGRNGESGHYEFPLPGGGVCEVAVNYPDA